MKRLLPARMWASRVDAPGSGLKSRLVVLPAWWPPRPCVRRAVDGFDGLVWSVCRATACVA